VIAAHRDSPKRERITSNDDSDGPDSTLRVTVADETGFLLRVNDFERRHGDAFVYWIDVEAVEPRVTVSVPPAQTKTQQRLVAAVPRGNRTAVFFNAQRNDCSDPVRIECEGLPAGVSVATAPIVDPAPGGLVVFEAAADAAASTRAALASDAVLSASSPVSDGSQMQIREDLQPFHKHASPYCDLDHQRPFQSQGNYPLSIHVLDPLLTDEGEHKYGYASVQPILLREYGNTHSRHVEYSRH
jgi:hypothetical protein